MRPGALTALHVGCTRPTTLEAPKTIAHGATPEAPEPHAHGVQAGPPYEDIAFRIVNKEWNYARKHGFRCAFERGILHLFFNLKRTRYRR